MQKFIDYLIQTWNGFSVYQIVGASFLIILIIFVAIIFHKKNNKQPEIKKVKSTKVKPIEDHLLKHWTRSRWIYYFRYKTWIKYHRGESPPAHA